MTAEELVRCRPCRALAMAGVILASPASVSRAQGGPVFQLQPGVTVADFVSAPVGVNSTTAFSLRFETRFPTTLSWLTPVVGAVLLPYGSTGPTPRNTDAPTVFVGNAFRIVSASQTGGWLDVELPLLLTHAPGAAPTGNIRDYGRDLVIMPTLYLHIGGRALAELGSLWSRMSLFAHVEHNLTPNRDPDTLRRDHFNPVATVGISLSSRLPN